MRYRPGSMGGDAAELSRRQLIERALALGAAAIVSSALPLADAFGDPAPALADTPLDPLLQAFADTVIPGRPATRTDLGDPIDPRAIAGVDRDPGAVEADVLRVMQDPVLGFPALAPVFAADLVARSLAAGGDFMALDFDRRSRVVSSGLDFANPLRTVWEAAAGLVFVAFCAAGAQREPTGASASGYRVMGYPGAAPDGYAGFSYRRRLARERTRGGSLP